MNQTKRPRAEGINSLTNQQVVEICQHLMRSTFTRNKERVPYLSRTERGWRCNLAATKDSNGEPKYPMFSINRWLKGQRVLVHLLWWRYENLGKLVDPDQTISHLDVDRTILRLVQEPRELNESRKYCHLYKWYRPLPGEIQSRCPHKQNPCTGPFIKGHWFSRRNSTP